MRWSKLPKKLALAAGSTLALAVGAELVARALEPGPFSFWDERPYEPDDELPHVHRPGFEGRWDGTWYGINSLGMRGPEITRRPATGEVRILAVGDSCTFGKGVEDADTWPRQLERLVGDRLPPGRHAVVANLGVNGYSGWDYRKVVEDVGLGLQPDLVIVGYNLNDFPNVIRKVDRSLYGETSKLRRSISKEWRDRLGRLALFRAVRSMYYALGRERAYRQAEQLAAEVGEADVASDLWAEQRVYLGGLVRAARQRGAEVAIFLFPYESQVYVERYDRSPIERLQGICADLDVVFFDLAEALREYAHEEDPPRRLFLRGDRYHPNAEGYGVVARSVLDVIEQQGWLQEGAGG